MEPGSHQRGAPTVVFVPTTMELRGLDRDGDLARGLALITICGVGPIASAARAAEALASVKPVRALLIGIAGTYAASDLPVASALAFDVVTIDGVGAGLGAEARSLAAMGFPHCVDDRRDPPREIGDRLALVNPSGARRVAAGQAAERGPALLVTTCSASSSSSDAEHRRERFPGALAEDMEGFAVALACELAGVPLTIVRGISNVAGERDHRQWRIDDALSAARGLARDILDSRSAIGR